MGLNSLEEPQWGETHTWRRSDWDFWHPRWGATTSTPGTSPGGPETFCVGPYQSLHWRWCIQSGPPAWCDCLLLFIVYSDLPLLLILSVYKDFYPLEFGKKCRFSSLKFGKIKISSRPRKGFLYILFRHTDFSPKILIFLVILYWFCATPEWQVCMLCAWVLFCSRRLRFSFFF